MAVDGTKWQFERLQKRREKKLEQLKDDMRLFVDCNTIRIQLSGFEFNSLLWGRDKVHVKLRKRAKLECKIIEWSENR